MFFVRHLAKFPESTFASYLGYIVIAAGGLKPVAADASLFSFEDVFRYDAKLFRRWSTQVLKTYLLKGYAINARLNQLEDKVDRRLAQHDRAIVDLKERVDFFVQTKEPPLQSIFYQNKFWDAKSLLIKFIRRAKKDLIVIDAYPGVATGKCCQCVNVAVTAPCGLSGISRYQEKTIEFDLA